jgi:hypothetical protein
MLKSDARGGLETRSAEPTEITISVAGMVTDIVQLRSREQMERIDEEHVWTKPLIEMRFGYKPENPLYLLLVRAYRLGAPVTIGNTPAYAGCKSWVPLDQAVEVGGKLVPVLDDGRYEVRRKRLLDAMGN